MDPQTKLFELSARLDKSTDQFEKYELMIELSTQYQKMWKLRKALETSQDALLLSKKIIYDQFPSRRIRKSENSSFYALKIG